MNTKPKRGPKRARSTRTCKSRMTQSMAIELKNYNAGLPTLRRWALLLASTMAQPPYMDQDIGSLH
eukprot:11633082-Karenia_brevis.AAC.1